MSQSNTFCLDDRLFYFLYIKHISLLTYIFLLTAVKARNVCENFTIIYLPSLATSIAVADNILTRAIFSCNT